MNTVKYYTINEDGPQKPGRGRGSLTATLSMPLTASPLSIRSHEKSRQSYR